MWYSYARLNENELSKIRLYEAETGKKILAFARVEASPAKLTEEELHKLEALEHEVGFVLVAVD
jgi:hypothetical protein